MSNKDTTSPDSDSMTDAEWLDAEHKRMEHLRRLKGPSLINCLLQNYRASNMLYNRLKAARLISYLFGDGGPLSPNRKVEREYGRGGDKVRDT